MKLHSRAAEEMDKLRYQSELNVAFLQIAVITAFFALYYLSPSVHTPDAPVFSAPLGLSLFTILILLRLWFAYTDQLSRFFLGASVIAEMSLLIFIIWTYHIQFETNPVTNLKNSHFTYIFILIALRALRFDPLWVILSGCTAAVGWSVLVLVSLDISNPALLTWDYVTYASTIRTHPGGEFDKIISILLVTVSIALVLKRARRTLFESIGQKHAAQDLSKFFDSDVAQKIISSEEKLKSGYGEMRKAAILFTDMRGFTKASAKLSAEELIELLGQYQALLVPIIQKHNGSIDKFMGDGILASFGAVECSQTYAADALRAIDEINQATDKWKAQRIEQGLDPINVGAGLATGEIVFGVIGDKNRMEYTVIGESVNLAAKLEKHNKGEKVNGLTTLDTLELAKSQGYELDNKEIRKERNVPGVNNKIDLVVLA